MSTSHGRLTHDTQSLPVRSLDSIRPTPAKAVLPSDHIGLTVVDVTIDALLAHYGGVKQMAYALGEGAGQLPLDPSLMMREFKDGKLGRLRHCDETALASVTVAMDRAFGKLTTPEARARQMVREIRQRLDELAQYLEMAS